MAKERDDAVKSYREAKEAAQERRTLVEELEVVQQVLAQAQKLGQRQAHEVEDKDRTIELESLEADLHELGQRVRDLEFQKSELGQLSKSHEQACQK